MPKDQLLGFRTYLLSLTEIPLPELDFICAQSKLHNIVKKQILVHPGDKVYSMYFVCTGLLKTFYNDVNGEAYTKGFGAENALVAPYVSFLTATPANLGIEALEKTTILQFDMSILNKLYARHSCWQVIGRKIVEHLLIERERRELAMLILNAEKRYEEFQVIYKNILNRIPLYEQASYLGITAVALSQIRAKTKKNTTPI